MPEIEIRPANYTDISNVIEIDHSYQSNYVWQMDMIKDESQLGVSFREIRLPRPVTVEYPRVPGRIGQDWEKRSFVLVAVLGGDPIGYISITEGLAPLTAWVTDIAVHPTARRQGIASGLILAGQDWATQKGYRRMVLEMQSKNMAGIRMAQKLGYEFCGYNDHYYENQDIAVFFAISLR